MDTLKTISLVLVIIGGLNWGLVGLMGLDLVATIFGEMSLLSKIVYDLVGLAAIYVAFSSFAGTEPKEVNKPEEF